MKKYIFLIFAIGLTIQQTNGQLQSPTVQSVSYDETSGQYYITWDDPNVNTGYFKVYIFSKMALGQPFYDIYSNSVSGSSNSFAFDSVFIFNGKTFNLNKDIYFFAVEAYSNDPKITNSTDNLNLTPWNNAPNNIVLNATFDSSCYYTITLKWNKFYGWDPSADIGYKIQYKVAGKITFTVLQNSGSDFFNDTTLVIYCDTNILISGNDKKKSNYVFATNANYSFQVIPTYKSQSFKCNSNIVNVDTKIATRPEFINPDGTTIQSNNQVQLQFSVDPNSELYKYKVLRSSHQTGSYDTIAIIKEANKTIAYTDNIAALNSQYFYKLIALNNCLKNDGVKVKESGIESTIILKARQNGNLMNLSWCAYKGFEGNLHYSLVRIKGGSTVRVPLATDTVTSDMLDTIAEKRLIEICYRIEAVEENNPNSYNGHATSNSVCPRIEQTLTMQDYFTPNNDGKNDVFRAPIAYVAKEFKMIIYDRWGTKVFETSDSQEGWNGKYSNGNVAPLGAYIYYLKVKGSDGTTLEQKGTFLLMIP